MVNIINKSIVLMNKYLGVNKIVNTFKFYKYVFGVGWVAQTTGITHHTTKNTLTVKNRHNIQ